MGLQWAIRKTWTPLVVEGDSNLLIMLVKKIQKGKSAETIGENWRMEAWLCSSEHILRESPAITFHHVRRKANGVADALANYAVKQEEETMESEWDDI